MKPYYQDGAVTIYNCDCREILPQLEPVDLVLADPPYNVGKDYGQHNDSMTRENYELWCSQWFGLLSAKRKIIFPGHGNLGMWFRIANPHSIGCWFKPGNPAHGGLFQWAEWEPFLVYDPSAHAIGGSDVYRYPVSNQSDIANGHPCPKPLPLFSQIIHRTKAEFVVDPFMGSGTTLRAAKDLGRKAIGIEIEEKYCEIAARRMGQEVLQLNEFHFGLKQK